MAVGSSRAPETLDEYIVGIAEHQEACVKTEAVIPPPVSCSEATQTLYMLSQRHVFSIALAVVFLVMVIQLTKLALKQK
jgi:hypothetical protein